MPRRGEEKQHLAITEMGLHGIPVPDRAFRRRTMRLLQEADDFCRDANGMPRRALSRIGQKHRPHRHNGRRWCVGCGGSLDEVNQGCSNCKARDGMRRLTAARKRAREAA